MILRARVNELIDAPAGGGGLRRQHDLMAARQGIVGLSTIGYKRTEISLAKAICRQI